MKEKEDNKKNDNTVVNDGVNPEQFPTEQRLPKTDVQNIDVGQSDLDVTESKGSSQLKQDKVSNIITKEVYSGSSGSSGDGTKALAVSGGFDGTLGSSNATPGAERARSDSRYERKMDREINYIDYTPSEQAVSEYKEVPDLAQDPKSTVGFNGIYEDTSPRVQKITGVVPSDPLFERSVDFIMRDEVYFSEGQQVQTKGDTKTLMPRHTAVKATSNSVYNIKGYTYTDSPNYFVKRGNYLHRNMQVTYDTHGTVLSMAFDVIDATTKVSDQVKQRSAAARDNFVNKMYLLHNKIVDDAGDTTKPGWSCFAWAIKDQDEVLGLLHDLESMTGAEMFINSDKLNLSHSFQLSRAHKDGQSKVRPAVEAFVGMNKESSRSSTYDAYNLTDGGSGSIFTTEQYANGNASLFVAANDTVKKYTSKGKILTAPQSIRLAVSKARNNIAPIRCNPKLIQSYRNAECFATIDRSYDALLPVCMSDKAGLIQPLNYNDIHSFVKPGLINTGSSGSSVSRVLISDNAVKLYTGYKIVFSDKTKVSKNLNELTISDSTSNLKFKFALPTYSGSSDEKVLTLGTDITGALTIKGKEIDIEANDEKYYRVGYGPYVYCFTNQLQPWLTICRFPLLQGLEDYLNDGDVGSKYNSLLKGNQLTVRTVASTQFFSLWSVLLCAASSKICDVRTTSFREIEKYTKEHGYPFTDLIQIKEVLNTGYSNLNFTDIDTKLTPVTMKPITALSWIFPEMFWNLPNTNGISVHYQKNNAASVYKELFKNPSSANTTHYVYYKKSSAVTVTTTESSGNVYIDLSGAGSFAYIYSDTELTDLDDDYTAIEATLTSTNDVFAIRNAENYTIDGAMVSTMLPFYFNEQDYDLSDDSKLVRKYDSDHFTMPSIRSGLKLKALDDIYSMTAQDLLLSLDAIVDIHTYDANGHQVPELMGTKGTVSAYKYAMASDGMMVATFKDGISLKQFISMPRMLGYHFVSPVGLLTPIREALNFENTDILSGTSYRIKYFTNKKVARCPEASSVDSDVLTDAEIDGYNIEEGANFVQDWVQNFADNDTTREDIGMLFSLRDLFDEFESTNTQGVYKVTVKGFKSLFAPFMNIYQAVNEENEDEVTLEGKRNNGIKVLSMQKALWTRAQKLPFVISPFDAYHGANMLNQLPVDIFDYAYIFGLCGFRAADYHEYVQNRRLIARNQARLFVNDPYVVDSPLFKEGAIASGTSEQSLKV